MPSRAYERPVGKEYPRLENTIHISILSANSVTRMLNRMGRGYSLPVLRARLLYGWNRKRVSRHESGDDPGVDEHEKGVSISTLIGQG